MGRPSSAAVPAEAPGAPDRAAGDDTSADSTAAPCTSASPAAPAPDSPRTAASDDTADAGAGGRNAGGGRGPPARQDSRAKLRKTSKFRGVAICENSSWRARLRYGKYTIHLGRCACRAMWEARRRDV